MSYPKWRGPPSSMPAGVTLSQVPPFSVVVPGSLPGKPGRNGPSPNLYCAVIVKRVDEKTRSKTSINELLRD